MNNFIYILFVLTLFSACNSDNTVNNENNTKDKDISTLITGKLYAEYYVRFLEDEGVMKSIAKYKGFNQNQQEVSYFPLGGVQLDGVVMNLNSALQNYEYEGPMEYNGELSFNYTSHRNASVSDVISMGAMNNIRIKEGVLSKSNGFTLEWDGEKLTKDQQLVILIETRGETPFSMTKMGATKDNTLYIRKEQLKRLKKGKSKLTLVKKQLIQKHDDPHRLVGGGIEYYAFPLEVDVVD